MSNELRSLLARVEDRDPDTAKELRRHIDALQSRRQFGLNFERHMPESVALTGRPISVGDKVRFLPPRGETTVESDATWVVTKITGPKNSRVASLVDPKAKDEATRALEDLVYVADFRDPIYPGLKRSGDPVLRGGDKPFHTVINAENYHALEAMLFTCQGQVDCIYIDPPYNTRANDWKYNNDFVDPSDSYAHSKWLAFIERRLKLARKLLNPRDSVLIVAIDEKEYLRLGLLLEQTFPEAKIQMVTTVIKPEGTGRKNEFSRTNEFLFFVMLGEYTLVPTEDSMVEADEVVASDENTVSDEMAGKPVEWRNLRRRERESVRGSRKNQFYAVFVDETTGRIHSVGDALDDDVPSESIQVPPNCRAIFPLNKAGDEMIWSVKPTTLRRLVAKQYARFNGRIVQFLQEGTVAAIERGDATITGEDEFGGVVAIFSPGRKTVMPRTLWVKASHNSQASGSLLLKALVGDRSFPFPKSLYGVEDCLRFFISRKPDALIVDFFAGSGTTAHAVMRLNKEFGGRRRSISVTNNEINDQEVAFLKKGLRPGDAEWEAAGICDYITKPRIKAAVTGLMPNGEPIQGNYRFINPFPMSDGFEENVEFFTLTYENPALVELDMAFERIAPLLWMRAGSEGRRIDERSDTFDVADTYAVLFNVDASKQFLAAVEKAEGLRIAYIVTDDETQYQAVSGQLPEGIESVRLYESYLRTFQINTGRA